MAETANPRFLRPITEPGADPGRAMTFAQPLRLDSGRTLEPFTVAYMTYGTLNAQKSNVVLVCHALSLDQFDAQGSAKTGAVTRGVRAEVARAVRRLVASVGVVAASYRNGVIILIAPEVDANSARELGETLRKTVARLRLRNSESVVSDYVTASVVAITGRVKRAVDNVQLLTHAISKLKDATGAGGDRVLALTI